MSYHRERSEETGDRVNREDERHLLKRTIEASLAEGATLLDAIEEAARVVGARCDDRDGAAPSPAEVGPRSGIRRTIRPTSAEDVQRHASAEEALGWRASA